MAHPLRRLRFPLPAAWLGVTTNDSVAAAVSAFFVTRITVGIIAGLTISPRKTSVRLSMPAAKAATVIAGAWVHLHHRHLGSEPQRWPQMHLQEEQMPWKQRTWKQRKSNAMQTVKIRELRGTDLRERARNGKPLAITNRGALVGVIIPVTQAWVEHLIDYNWSHVRQSIAEGELAMAADTSMLTIDDVVAQADARGYDEGRDIAARKAGGATCRGCCRRDRDAAAGDQGNPRAVAGTAEPLRRAEERPSRPCSPFASATCQPSGSSRAGEGGHTLALTHDRELVGIVIPVTQGLVEFLIEQNMSRVLYNIALGEKQLTTSDKMTTLERGT